MSLVEVLLYVHSFCDDVDDDCFYRVYLGREPMTSTSTFTQLLPLCSDVGGSFWFFES